MQRQPLFLACLAVVGFAVGLGGFQNESSEQAIRLRLPDRADLTGLSIQYFLEGPFGGFGSFVRTDPGVREYALETWRGGQPATTLKAIIYCPGYRIALLRESALAGRRIGTLPIGLEPLGTIPLSGRLTSVPAPQRLTIEAVYFAYWGHRFFGITDGRVASFTVATSKVAADGAFALNVPDFARDPVVTSFPEGPLRGSLRLIGREAESGNIPFVLEEIRQAGQEITFPVAPEYPRDLLLVAIRR